MQGKTSNFYLFVMLTILAAMLLFAAYFMPDLKTQAWGVVILIVGAVLHAIDPAAPLFNQTPCAPAQPQNARIEEK